MNRLNSSGSSPGLSRPRCRDTSPTATISGCGSRRSLDIELGHAINRVYRILKGEAVRLNRALLPLEMRRALYTKIEETVTASIKAGRPGDLTLHLPAGIVPGGWSLSRQVDYRLMNDS